MPTASGVRPWGRWATFGWRSSLCSAASSPRWRRWPLVRTRRRGICRIFPATASPSPWSSWCRRRSRWRCCCCLRSAAGNAADYLGLTLPRRGDARFRRRRHGGADDRRQCGELAARAAPSSRRFSSISIARAETAGWLFWLWLAVDGGDADRRGDLLPWLSVPRLAALAARRLAGDRRHRRCSGRSSMCNTTSIPSPRSSSSACCSAGCAGPPARRS